MAPNLLFYQKFPTQEALSKTLMEEIGLKEESDEIRLISLFIHINNPTDEALEISRLFKELLPEHYAKYGIIHIYERQIPKTASPERRKEFSQHILDALQWVCVEMVIYK